MSPQKRVAAAAVLVVFALSGCRTTRYSSVTMPREEVTANGDACYRRCMGLETADYLDCMRGCPDAHVFDDQGCNDTPLIPSYVCTEHATTKFSAGKTIVLVIVLSLLAGGAYYGVTAPR